MGQDQSLRNAHLQGGTGHRGELSAQPCGAHTIRSRAVHQACSAPAALTLPGRAVLLPDLIALWDAFGTLFPACKPLDVWLQTQHACRSQTSFHENANDLRQRPLGRHSIRPAPRTCLPRGGSCMPPTGRGFSSGGLWRLHGKQQLRVGCQHSSYTLISVHGQQRHEEGVQEGAKIPWKQLTAPLLQVSLCRQALACSGAPAK